MKKDTNIEHTKIANNILYYIYKYIDSDINLDNLSKELKVSKFHMHRIFKNEFKRNIYESIKSIRLQKASMLLITNKNSTITQVANSCGYSSSASFIKAFKAKYGVTPSKWRNSEYKKYLQDIKDFENLVKISIEKMNEIEVFYIRHKGYNKEIAKIWQKLQVFSLTNNLKDYRYIALYHDNPTITPINECQYVACIESKELKSSTLPKLKIPSGVYAKFNFSGKYGDILKFMNWVYFKWLIDSGYETTTNPAYTIYHKNHFLNNNQFEVSYYLPVKL